MNRTEARIFRTALAFSLIASASRIAAAQSPPLTEGSLRHEVFVSTPGESYLRYLQTLGKVPEYPWASRGFSQRELKHLIPADTVHPWSDRYTDGSREAYGIRYRWLSPSVSLRYNSAFAYGSNDGPIWAGRGTTSAVQVGFYAEFGPLNLSFAPVGFRAENKEFARAPTGPNVNGTFQNPDFLGVDRPQRFGNAPYAQIDPGQTTLRLDLPVVTAGASTANLFWGPGQEFPVLLGNNAAGFPHLFVGTSQPVDAWLFKLHAKVFWGELLQSKYSPVTGSNYYTSVDEPGRRRFTTGLVATLQPRGFDGLELGGSRFFHSIWPRSGIPRSYLTRVFQDILKKNLKPDSLDLANPSEEGNRGVSDNQLMAVFARWVLPHSGLELHFEYGREDFSYDFRDLTQEPDHSRAYAIGARKVIRFAPARLIAARFELMNFQLPELARYRGEGEMYVHGLIRQGHTHKGQMLGADAGVGTGAGSVVAIDHFNQDGRWTASWTRIVRREDGNYTSIGVRSPRSIDVSHGLGFEASRIVSGMEVSTGLTYVYEFNRDFVTDKSNINALVSVRYLLR